MKRSGWHILGFLVAALLWGCGGAGGPAAGPGGALDGGAAVGGPVGGGNFAAGPVSLPAPTVVAPDAPVTWTNISCTNVPGPNFECRGAAMSVLPNTEVQLRIFPPASAVARDTFSVVADAQGAWSATRAGEAGESVEICPKDKAGCWDYRIYKLPPEGGVVDGNSGTMKNLVIDPMGNSWHSRLFPKGFSLGRLVASLFISEARAQEAPRPYTAIYCSEASAFSFLEVLEENAPRCHLFQAARGAVISTRALSFDNCQQSDIRSIVSLRQPTTGEPMLLVAVKNRIHLIYTQPSPRIAWTYSFPGEVVSILELGDRIIAVVNAPTGVEHNLYYVDLRQKAPLGTGCYNPLEWLKGVENVTSSDAVSDAFTMVIYKQPGVYQAILGRTLPGSTIFRTQPAPLLLPSTTPLEARILKVEQNWVWVAVLNAAEKKIKVIKHYMAENNSKTIKDSNPGTDIIVVSGEPDQVQEIALEGLSSGGVNLSVFRPHFFNVNRSSQEMVYIDVSERGSKFVAIPFSWVSGEFGSVTQATVTDLGGASPASLRRDNTEGDSGWAYNDGTWQIRRVRTLREQLQIQAPSTIINDEIRLQLTNPDRITTPPSEEDEDSTR